MSQSSQLPVGAIVFARPPPFPDLQCARALTQISAVTFCRI